jgi:methylated-DNA-protein-cysteine methyltransferase-like protein
MPRTPEAESFFIAVYQAVQAIPHGRVTTYGHIATLIGTPERPRQVGVCLKALSADPDARFNHDNVPWQRVINARAMISPRSTPGGAASQADALAAEGVHVQRDALGVLSVDFSDYGWFPDCLPSVVNASEEEEGPGDAAGDVQG